MIQVVFDRNYYNYQGMYEENVGLRIGTEVRWYAHIDHTGREDSEQLKTYDDMVALLNRIVDTWNTNIKEMEDWAKKLANDVKNAND